jgi:hypothetical protein
MPASAATVAPYFRIGVAPQGSSFLRRLQGDLGGPLGSTVTQQPCNPDLTDASQLWLPLALGGNIYKFENIGTGRCLEARNGTVNGSTGFCLDIPGAQTTPRLQLQTWRCNGTLAQQFWVAQ